MQAPDGPNDRTTTIRLAPATALAFILALSTALLSYGNLQTRISQVEVWKDGAQTSKFTTKDFEKERALITADLDRLGQEILILCQELVYIEKRDNGIVRLQCPIATRPPRDR